MDDLLKIVGAFALVFVMIFISPILGVLAGAFTGWVVSMLAPVWVPAGLKLIGITVNSSQLVELGAALGFIGGFFRTSVSSKKDK